MSPFGGAPRGSLYDDFDDAMYTRALAHALGVSIDTVRPKPGHFATWLVDGDEPLDIPCEARPPDG